MLRADQRNQGRSAPELLEQLVRDDRSQREFEELRDSAGTRRMTALAQRARCRG